MKDIFTDLYNKVLGFFRQTEKNQEEESTKDVACNRLKFVLMQDRTNLTPELMDRMRKELVELLSKYVEMDKEALELGFEQEGNQMALMLSIPVLRAKDEAEIEATLAKEDEEKAKAEFEAKDDTEDITSETNDETVDSDDEISENSEDSGNAEDVVASDVNSEEADDNISASENSLVTKPNKKSSQKQDPADEKVKAAK